MQRHTEKIPTQAGATIPDAFAVSRSLMTTVGSFPRFNFEGQRVAYDVLGDGRPIVMVHGTPFSSYAW